MGTASLHGRKKPGLARQETARAHAIIKGRILNEMAGRFPELRRAAMAQMPDDAGKMA